MPIWETSKHKIELFAYTITNLFDFIDSFLLSLMFVFNDEVIVNSLFNKKEPFFHVLCFKVKEIHDSQKKTF